MAKTSKKPNKQTTKQKTPTTLIWPHFLIFFFSLFGGMNEIKVSEPLSAFLFVKQLVVVILHGIMAPGITITWILNKCNFSPG